MRTFSIVLVVFFAAFLFGCVAIPGVTVPVENVSVNISISPNVSIPENITIIIPWIGGVLNATPTPVVLPEKVEACIFGERSEVIEELLSEGVVHGEKTIKVGVKWLDNTAKLMDLEDCALIVLKDSGEGKYLDFVPRTAVKEKVFRGTGLIVFGDAGTLVHGDPAVRGWDYVLGQVVPVTLPEEGANLSVNGTFVMAAKDPALEGIGSFNVTGLNLTEVYLGNGEAIAFIRTGPYQTSVAYYAVVRGRAGKGIVYHVSFAPEASPQVFRALSGFLIKSFAGIG